MKRPSLSRRIPETIEVGRVISFRRTLTDGDVSLFIGATWDVNPLHTDDVYAEGTDFGRRIVPGLLTASLLTHLGGLWAFMATRMELTFLAPVFVGDTILAEAKIVDYEPERGWVRLECSCVNREGEVVLRGNVDGYPGIDIQESSEG
ncbi:MAG: MaoC family dehydratase [Anaerolineales bacterium]|nr:MaoC family dehydratase [Anaerolineales bacterium]TFH34854.1 MAG: MaoC family dehydratase [Anaerolineales bacterium]